MSIRAPHRRRNVLKGAAVALSAAVALTCAAGTGTAAEASGGHGATQRALDALERAGMPGVAAEVKDARGKWFGSTGYADTATKRKRTPADHLRAGSNTKSFVAVVLLQLEAEGRLRLDDSVERWLPGVLRGNGYDGTKVTVRQLLNHTSGVHDMVSTPEWREYMNGPGFLAHRYETRTPRQIVDMALKYAPDFEPGTGWNYSNTNYVLAGMIIEKVTGNTYAHEAGQRIIKRLKLRETTFPGTDPTMPAPHPVGYSKLYAANPGPEVHDATEYNPAWSGATGEVISTTGDLNRYYSALIKGELLPPAQQRKLLDTVETGTFFEYGAGLIVRTLSCGVKVYGHDGIVWGSLTSSATTADGKHTLTFHINGDWLEDGKPYEDVFEAEFCGKG
ncbi:D-alanyl-D-alanine carboxypeptidase [Streptomyces longispororuber]|uniref:D-alanyl-D-alanine carboxypeptidase n=1 Tax=Streptomyces longispororuber TaxID=68230 RepID=A0A918Z3N1_9ACTN|nr:serine hydrolase domain-containing protein [Streptomyces longispororuber]GHE35558.1 D-alanyl-D-alanine carboxypeptidase [Streptomyces longispororuber]